MFEMYQRFEGTMPILPSRQQAEALLIEMQRKRGLKQAEEPKHHIQAPQGDVLRNDIEATMFKVFPKASISLIRLQESNPPSSITLTTSPISPEPPDPVCEMLKLCRETRQMIMSWSNEYRDKTTANPDRDTPIAKEYHAKAVVEEKIHLRQNNEHLERKQSQLDFPFTDGYQEDSETTLIKPSNDVNLSFSGMILPISDIVCTEEERSSCSSCLSQDDRVWEPGGLLEKLDMCSLTEKYPSHGEVMKLTSKLHETCLRNTLENFIQPAKEIRGWILNENFNLETYRNALLVEGLRQLTLTAMKFHLRHKWRSRLLRSFSGPEFCVDNIVLFTDLVRLSYSVWEQQSDNVNMKQRELSKRVWEPGGVAAIERAIELGIQLLVGLKREICADAYLVEFSKMYGCESNTSEGMLKIHQSLELRTNGFDAEFVKRVEAPQERVLGKRPRDPGRFSDTMKKRVSSEKQRETVYDAENKKLRSVDAEDNQIASHVWHRWKNKIKILQAVSVPTICGLGSSQSGNKHGFLRLVLLSLDEDVLRLLDRMKVHNRRSDFQQKHILDFIMKRFLMHRWAQMELREFTGTMIIKETPKTASGFDRKASRTMNFDDAYLLWLAAHSLWCIPVYGSNQNNFLSSSPHKTELHGPYLQEAEVVGYEYHVLDQVTCSSFEQMRESKQNEDKAITKALTQWKEHPPDQNFTTKGSVLVLGSSTSIYQDLLTKYITFFHP